MEGVLKGIQELRTAVTEIKVWGAGVDSRLGTLEEAQRHQQEQVTELETGTLLVKEELAEQRKQVAGILQRLERSCKRSVMELGLLALTLFSAFLIIYKILKDER